MTSGYRRCSSSAHSQCVVARRPSSSPAAASTKAPEQIDAIRTPRRDAACSNRTTARGTSTDTSSIPGTTIATAARRSTIRRDPPRSVGSLAPLLEWMAAHMTEALTVRQIAARARMSERSFARHFQEQVGVTPMRWLLNARIRRAQELLEASTAYADDIAISCGFQSTVTFRSSFKRIVGLTPVEYRRTFNSPAAAVAMAASATQ